LAITYVTFILNKFVGVFTHIYSLIECSGYGLNV